MQGHSPGWLIKLSGFPQDTYSEDHCITAQSHPEKPPSCEVKDSVALTTAAHWVHSLPSTSSLAAADALLWNLSCHQGSLPAATELSPGGSSLLCRCAPWLSCRSFLATVGLATECPECFASPQAGLLCCHKGSAGRLTEDQNTPSSLEH